MNRFDRRYTALMLTGVGLLVGFALYTWDVSRVLTIGVVLAFTVAALIAFRRQRRNG